MDFILDYYFDFEIIGDEIGPLLDGLWITVKLSLYGGICALVWGLILAVVRQLPGRWTAPLRIAAITYIDVFRAIPMLLVLLLVSSSLSAFVGEDILPRWLGSPTWLGETTAFWWGVFSLTITYGAYMAEVYRAGIEAVPHGQVEAARSLGMSHAKAMRHVVLPQAVRKVLPPLLNDFIALMKDTSLVAVIGGLDLVQVGRDINSEYISGVGLIFGAACFILMTIPLARYVDWLIKKQQRQPERIP